MSIVLDGTLGITTPAETVQGALTTTGNTILGDASTDTLNVGNGGLVKDASGNVGIGTASPASKLTVAGGADSTIRNTASSGSSWFVGSNTAGYILHNESNTSTFITTNGVTQAAITSAGLLQFNSGYGSVATAYGCRAWVNFNGTGTVAIRASGNVSSITDNADGDYTVNFTTAIVDANYSVVGMGKAATAADGTSVWIKNATTPTTGIVNIMTGQTGRSGSTTSVGLDNAFNSIAVFR